MSLSSNPHLNEAQRVASLQSLQVLDSAPEAEFDALVRAAALVCAAPISLISLIDDHRQWFKANHGLPGVAQTPRDIAFCAQTISLGELFEVEDATRHPQFIDNPLVTGHPNIRFYAGAPVRLSDGAVVGTLCVIDRQPRRLDAQQREVLGQLAIAAAQALQGRRAVAKLHRTGAALAMLEAQFRTLSEHFPLGVFHTDAQGRCTYTNPRWQQIFGIHGERALGEGWTATLHPQDKAALLQAWDEAAVDGREFDRVFRLLHPNQTVRTVRARARPVFGDDGRVDSFVGSVEDMTRRNLLEDFLDRTGRLARVGGWELDLATRRLVWSAQTRRIHEVPADHAPTLESALAFYPLDGRARLSAAIQAAIERGMPWDLELPMTTAAGRRIWVRNIGEPEYDGARAVRLLGAIKDVSEDRSQRAALHEEQALRQKVEQQAAETERLLAERSEMLDILAHEVRQPLNNASAALQSAASVLGAAHDRAASPRLARAQAVLAQVLGGIDNTLAVASLLARPDPIERDDTDIDTLLAVTIADLPPAARSRVRIVRDSSLRTASMDMNLMRLALRNLLVNALRYSPAGTPVEVRLADSDEPLALLIEVRDQGPGIAARHLPRLFERAAHRRLARQVPPAPPTLPRDAASHGLGLGLYIVRRVMELHGGSVRLVFNGPQGVTMLLTVVQPLGD